VQCVADPLAALRSLAALRAPFVSIARLPYWRGETVVGLQTMRLIDCGIGPLPPGMADRAIGCPVTFVDFAAIKNALSGYEIVLPIDAPSGGYSVNGNHIRGITAIFRRITR